MREVVVLALPGEGAGLRPGRQDQVMRLMEAGMAFGRVHRQRMVLGADPPDEAGDQPAAGDVVEHREFLGDRQRVRQHRQRPPQHRDLRGVGNPPRQHPGEDVRAGHDAIGILVMLVDADTLEAELGGVFQLIQVAVVQVGALQRVVVAVRQRHPGRRVELVVVGIEVGIGHQVEEEEPHCSILRMKPSTSSQNAPGASLGTACPMPGSTTASAPGISPAQWAA